MTYDKLSWRDFGWQLLKSGDLDPIYIMLSQASLTEEQLKTWLMSYFCFYHAGVSCDIVGKQNSWSAFRDYLYPSAPRGSERRHFRGEAAVKAVEYLARTFETPAAAVDWLISPSTFREVNTRAQSLPLFGPWISFKVADMAERVLRKPIDFSDCELSFYSEPVKGASLLVRGSEDYLDPRDVNTALKQMWYEFHGYPAPPWNDRPVGLQEYETILCKWHSHMRGHYPLWKDTREIREGLEKYGSLAHQMRVYLPTVPETN